MNKIILFSLFPFMIYSFNPKIMVHTEFSKKDLSINDILITTLNIEYPNELSLDNDLLQKNLLNYQTSFLLKNAETIITKSISTTNITAKYYLEPLIVGEEMLSFYKIPFKSKKNLNLEYFDTLTKINILENPSITAVPKLIDPYKKIYPNSSYGQEQINLSVLHKNLKKNSLIKKIMILISFFPLFIYLLLKYLDKISNNYLSKKLKQLHYLKTVKKLKTNSIENYSTLINYIKEYIGWKYNLNLISKTTLEVFKELEKKDLLSQERDLIKVLLKDSDKNKFSKKILDLIYYKEQQSLTLQLLKIKL